MKSSLIILGLVVCAYAFSLAGDFILDDYIVIVNNPFIRSGENLGRLFSPRYVSSVQDVLYNQWSADIGSGETSYRPVATASYFLNYFCCRLQPWGYRAVNLGLHAVNAVLVYLLLLSVLSSRRIALTAALVFGLHPVQLEVVSCSAYRPNSLACLFALLSLVFYFRWKKERAGPGAWIVIAGSLLSLVLSLFSKEIAIMVPVALVLCDYCAEQCNAARLMPKLKWYALYCGVVAGFCAVYFLLLTPKQTIFTPADISAHTVRMFDTLGIYLRKLVVPHDVVFIFSGVQSPVAFPNIAAGVAAVAGAGYCYFVRKRIGPALFFGCGWFLLWLFPMNNFFNDFRIPLAHRFLYIPLVGFGVVAGALLEKLAESKGEFFRSTVVRHGIYAGVLGAYFILTGFTSVTWQNETRLFSSCVEKQPQNAAAHLALARVLLFSAGYGEAEKELSLVASGTMQVSRYEALRMHNLQGLLYTQTGRFAQAEEEFRRSLQMNPDAPFTHLLQGVCFERQGKYRQALESYAVAKRLSPYYVPAYVASGRVYMALGENAHAGDELRQALTLDPGSAEAGGYLRALQQRGGAEDGK